MKRVLALLAALLLFVLPCAQALAAMPPQAEAPVRLPVWEEDAPAPAAGGQLSVVIQPGLWLQNFTTFEPDDSMIEVGIRALELVLPEEKGADAW